MVPNDLPSPSAKAIGVSAPLISETSDVSRESVSGEIAGPVRQVQRIVAIDVLRGVALLGILIMNIRAMASIWQTYEQPHALGEVSGLDWYIWIAGYLLADMKFMAIFSMLFGAGIVLMASRMKETGRRPAGLHYRRMFWLLIIGLIHAYLIWSGDILVWYAISGSIVYVAWRWRPRIQVALGVFLLAVGVAFTVVPGQLMPAEEIAEMNEALHPSAERIERQITAFRGSWIEQMPHRADHAFGSQIFGGIFFGFWRAAGLMLIGMALFKTGVFSAARSMRFYVGQFIAGLAIGMPLVIYGLVRDIEAGFAAEAVFFTNAPFNHIGTVLVALAWVGVVMIVVKAGVLTLLSRCLAAVGQMALTNYLMQSIVCTLIFYGHGFGLFGSLGFADQMYVLFAVWLAQLIWSPLWLQHYRYGPFEWLWRSLTYWRRQPMRRAALAVSSLP